MELAIVLVCIAAITLLLELWFRDIHEAWKPWRHRRLRGTGYRD